MAVSTEGLQGKGSPTRNVFVHRRRNHIILHHAGRHHNELETAIIMLALIAIAIRTYGHTLHAINDIPYITYLRTTYIPTCIPTNLHYNILSAGVERADHISFSLSAYLCLFTYVCMYVYTYIYIYICCIVLTHVSAFMCIYIYIVYMNTDNILSVQMRSWAASGDFLILLPKEGKNYY